MSRIMTGSVAARRTLRRTWPSTVHDSRQEGGVGEGLLCALLTERELLDLGRGQAAHLLVVGAVDAGLRDLGRDVREQCAHLLVAEVGVGLLEERILEGGLQAREDVGLLVDGELGLVTAEVVLHIRARRGLLLALVEDGQHGAAVVARLAASGLPDWKHEDAPAARRLGRDEALEEGAHPHGVDDRGRRAARLALVPRVGPGLLIGRELVGPEAADVLEGPLHLVVLVEDHVAAFVDVSAALLPEERLEKPAVVASFGLLPHEDASFVLDRQS